MSNLDIRLYDAQKDLEKASEELKKAYESGNEKKIELAKRMYFLNKIQLDNINRKVEMAKHKGGHILRYSDAKYINPDFLHPHWK